MKKLLISILLILFAMVTEGGNGRAQIGTTDSSMRMNEVRQGLVSGLDKMRRALATKPGNVSVRDVSNWAFLTFLTGGPSTESDALLQRVFAAQNMDANSPEFGSIPWEFSNAGVIDANSIEFSTQSWGPIFLNPQLALSADLKRDAPGHIQAALIALERHHPPVHYTNIFLMNTVNTILLSEVVNDPVQHQRGLAQLEEWINYTRQNGIHEFDSPTYYATCLNSLVAGFCHVKEPELRAKFKAILDYFWEDIAANHNAAMPRALAGACSRDYDFLRGTGGLDDYLYAEGLVTARPFKDLDAEKVYMLDNGLGRGYHPTVQLANLPAERIVLQRWDENPTKIRSTYITSDFSIGTATADYGPQDKLFAVDFVTAKDLPSITVVPDTFDSPYGEIKTKDKSGHNKPRHAPLHPASVQDRGTVLLLLDLDPSLEKDAQSFSTSLILPAQADELLVDGQSVNVSGPFEQSVTPDAVLGVRENRACFAARFFQVDSFNGVAPQFELRAEEAGLKKGAARYVIYHARQIGPLTGVPSQLRVGLIVQTASWTSEEAFQAMLSNLKNLKIDQRLSAGVWTVTSMVDGERLEVAEDTAKHIQVEARINGQPVSVSPLSVNGREIELAP